MAGQAGFFLQALEVRTAAEAGLLGGSGCCCHALLLRPCAGWYWLRSMAMRPCHAARPVAGVELDGCGDKQGPIFSLTGEE